MIRTTKINSLTYRKSHWDCVLCRLHTEKNDEKFGKLIMMEMKKKYLVNFILLLDVHYRKIVVYVMW